jgi:uncharacterized membrane protein YeaQ/YmgE (transglycosylase-associated protein family)
MVNTKIIRMGAIIVIIFGPVCFAHILAEWTANQDSKFCLAVILLSILIGAVAALAGEYVTKKYPPH